MSALGIIVLIIFAILMLRGWIHGLLRMVLSVVIMVVVMALVTVATPHVRDFVKENTSIYTVIQEKSSGVLQERVEGSLETSTDESMDDIGLPQQISSYLVESGESMIAESGIYETVGEKIANWLVTGVCYLVMFGIGMIIVAIVRRLTKRANKVPVLGKINRLLGLALGCGEAYLVVCVVFLVIALASGADWGQRCTETIADNGFLTFLYQHNVILNFLSLE